MAAGTTAVGKPGLF